jgi:hypothetical protein
MAVCSACTFLGRGPSQMPASTIRHHVAGFLWFSAQKCCTPSSKVDRLLVQESKLYTTIQDLPAQNLRQVDLL